MMARHMCEEPSTYEILMRYMPDGESGECKVTLFGIETTMLLKLTEDDWLDPESERSIEASLRWRWFDAPRKDIGPRFCDVNEKGDCHLSDRVIVSSVFREPQQIINEIDLHMKKTLLVALFKSLTIGGSLEKHHYVGVDFSDGGEDPSIFFHHYYFVTRWKLSEIVVDNKVDFNRAKVLVDEQLAKRMKSNVKTRVRRPDVQRAVA